MIIATILLSVAIWSSTVLIIILLSIGTIGLILSIIFHKKFRKYLLPAYPAAFLILIVLTIGYIHIGEYNNYSESGAAVIRISYVTDDGKIMYGDMETPDGKAARRN